MEDLKSKEIDTLRGIAVLGVIVGHTLQTKFFVIDGAFWVWIFFITSGFLQAYYFRSGRYDLSFYGIKRYFLNRFLRIFPLFWLMLVFKIGLDLLLDHSINWTQVFLNFFCCTSHYGILGSLWSISTEIQMYVVVPLIVFLMRKDLFWIFFCIFLLLVFKVIPVVDNPNQPREILGNLPIFCLGVLTAHIYPINFRINPYIKYIIMGIIFFITLHILTHDIESFWRIWGVRLAAVLAIFMLLFQTTFSICNVLLRPVEFIGKYCYGIYVYAVLIGAIYSNFFNIKPGFYAFILQMMAVPVAFISYHTFEQYFLRFKLKQQNK